MKEQIYTKFHQYERPDEGYDQKPTIYSQDNIHYVIPTTYKIPEGFGQEFESHKEFDTTDAVQIFKALQDKGYTTKEFSSREEAEQFISSGNQDYLIQDDRSIKPVTINQKVLDEISKMADKKDITNPEDRLRFTANTLAAFYNEDNPLKPLLDVDKFIKNKSYYTDKENPVAGTDSIKLTELMTRLVVDKEGRPPSGGDFGIAFARRFIPGTVSTAAAFKAAETVGSFIPDPRLRTMLSIVGGMGAGVAAQVAVEAVQDPFLPKDTLNIQNAQFRELINNRDFASLLSDSATSTLLTGYLRNQGIKLNLNTAAFLAKTAEASEKTGGKKYVLLDAIQKLFNNSVHQSSNLKEGTLGLGEALAGSVVAGLTGDDADSFSAILGQLMGGAVTEKTFAAGSIGSSVFNTLKNPAKKLYYKARKGVGSLYNQETADKYAAKLEELGKGEQGILNEKYQRDVAGKLRENLIGLIPENRTDPETNEVIPLSSDEKMQVLDAFLQELGVLDKIDEKQIKQLGLNVTEDSRDLTRLDTQYMSNDLFKSLLGSIQGYVISQKKRMDKKGSRKATQNQVDALKHLVETMVTSGDPEHTQRLVDLHATAVEHDITKRIVDSTTTLVESYDRVKGLDIVKADGSSGTTDPYKGLMGKVVDNIDKIRAEARATENQLYKKIENSEKLAIPTFYDDKGNKLDRPPFLDKYLKERESLEAGTFQETRDEDLSKMSAIDKAIVKELAKGYDEESPDVINLAKITHLRKKISAKIRDLQDTNEQELKHRLIELDHNILQDLDNLSKFSKQDETLGDDLKNAIADYDVARSYTRGFYAAFGKIFDSKVIIADKYFDSPEIAMKNLAKETSLSALQIDKLYDLNRLLRASTTEFFGKDDLYALAGGAGNQRLSGLNVGEGSRISDANLGTLASNLMELERFRILNNIYSALDIDDSGRIISTDELVGNLTNKNFTQKQLRSVLDRADRIEKEQPELYSELQSFLGAHKTFLNEDENFKKIQEQVRDQKIFFDLLSPNFEKNTQIFKSFQGTEKPLEVINKVVNGSRPFKELNQILKIIDNPQLDADNAVNFEELNKSARNGFKRLLLEEAALASGITGTAKNDFLPSKMLYKLYAPLVQTVEDKKSKTSLMEWMIDNKLIDEQESDNLKAALSEMSRVDRIIADERYSANEQFDAVNKNSMAHLYVSMLGANVMASGNRVVSSLIPGFGNSNDASLQMASEGARKARETFNMFLEIPEQKKFDVLMDLVKLENFDTFKAMMLKTDDPDMVRKKTRKIMDFLMESAFIPVTLRRAAMQQAYRENRELAEESSDYLGIEALPETSRIYASNQPQTSVGEDVVNLMKNFFGRGSGGRNLRDNVQRKMKGGSERGILIGNILNKAFEKLGLRSYRKRPEDLKSSLKDQSKIRNLVLEEARNEFENLEGAAQIRAKNKQEAAKGMNLFQSNNTNPVNQNTNQTLTPEQKEAFKKDLGIASLTM